MDVKMEHQTSISPIYPQDPQFTWWSFTHWPIVTGWWLSLALSKIWKSLVSWDDDIPNHQPGYIPLGEALLIGPLLLVGGWAYPAETYYKFHNH